MNNTSTTKKIIKLCAAVISAFLAVIFAVVGACAIYLGDYYRADDRAIEAFAKTEIESQTLDDGTVIYAPENAAVGLIFYPGGKVEHTAYIPLMQACAEQGIFCALVKMPFRLAVLDIHAADGIQAQYPDIERWYIGGHSLGGSMAASYLAKRADKYEGLVLLGSYSTADLSESGLKGLTLYGSEDGVLNREKYESNRGNLPSGYTEKILDGGCHAYFGTYGAQEGDGTPTVTNEEQIVWAADEIADFLFTK